ncbi:MAG: hypothetical protein DMF50_02150 [Acidobacteria bacterium]|nr:MAG: hypothetical protein DMF50_02150 [Acidobacteriota bacterium]
MRALAINLATRPFRNNRVVGSVVAGLAAALVLTTTYNLYVYLNYSSRYSELQGLEGDYRSRLAGLETEERRLAKEIQARDFKRVYDQGKFANDLIVRRGFSWTQLFNTLEAVVPPDVMMTSLRPSFKEDGIIISAQGVAKNHIALYTLQDTLLKDRRFARVYPANERKLNPSRPEITFALNFDYLPPAPPAAPEAVTVQGGAPAAAMPAGPAMAASGAPPKEAAASAATPAPAKPGPAPEARGAPAGLPAPRGTVGRDGRPRGAAGLARLVAAPGGIYVPPGYALPSDGAPKGSHDRKPAPHEAAAGGAARPDPPVPAPPARSPAAPVTATAQAAARLTVPADPTAPVRAGGPAATPAVRLDVPLTFAARPVGEVYEALSRAHGVRFQIDPAVDRGARVTVDLRGKRLDDAIAAVSRAAGHRVSRQGSGLYTVVAIGGGEPIGEKPVVEEPLAPEERKP